MKAELASWEGDTFGVNLMAENEDENRALRRLFDKGAKINSITARPVNSTLQITFRDLIRYGSLEL